MRLMTTAFADGQRMPGDFAFCVADPGTHVKLSANLNPDFAWSDLPPETKSLVIICHDPDVPSRGDDVNKEGRVVPKSLARIDFFHWVIVDLPASMVGVQEGEYSSSVVSRGKPGPAAPGWFAADKDMSGNYFGYDGPCPPWNDELIHHYVFTLYAVEVPRLAVTGNFTGADALVALAGRVLAQASLTGVYTLNPALKI